MFLLKPRQRDWAVENPEYFTFHNVSINTAAARKKAEEALFFTFHNVSIKTFSDRPLCCLPQTFTFHNVSIKTFFWFRCFLCWFPFTFHNVSIKTTLCTASRWASMPLHSTMFLLKHSSSVFVWVLDPPLHSTMFLLKRVKSCAMSYFLYLYIPQCFY